MLRKTTKISKVRRIFHPWDRWECYPAGFYSRKPPAGMSVEDAEQAYAGHFTNRQFESSISTVLDSWPVSCEQFLTNDQINRIAWLGQASVFLSAGVPKFFKRAYFHVDERCRMESDWIAANAINRWIHDRTDRGLCGEMEATRLFA